MPKKIKVIDVVNNNDDNMVEKVMTSTTLSLSENDEIEGEIEAVMVEEKPLQAELIEQVKVEDKQDYKSIRTQQLVECTQCNKLMTATSLKYYHKKTCPAENKTEDIKPKLKAKPKSKPIKEEVIIEESDEEVQIIKPKPKNEILLQQAPVLTYQEQRMQQLNQQKNNRQHKINCLFMGAI